MADPLSLPKSYKRLDSFPIDADSVFTDLETMETYIAGGSSYAGQTVALVDTDANSVTLYNILPDKTYEEGAGKVDVDADPTEDSANPVSSGGVFTALANKAAADHTHTTDETPTADSTNLVTSGGVKSALDEKATIPETKTANKLWYTGDDGNPVETDFTIDQVVQTDAIDYSDDTWLAGEERLMSTKKTDSESGTFEGSVQLTDIFAPSSNDTALANHSGWSNESKTITGENYLGELGVTGQIRILDDGTICRCMSYTQGTSGGADGTAVYKRNRAIDCLDPDNNTYDSAVCDILDASRTDGTTDDGWDTDTNILTTSNTYCRVGTWWKNPGGYSYFCYAVDSGTYYWYRNGTPTTIFRQITIDNYPTLVANLLAHDFTSSNYDDTNDDDNETSYQDQIYWDGDNGNLYWKIDASTWLQFGATTNLVSYTATKTLTNTQLKALLATPITLVAAQGASTIVVITDVKFILYAGTEVLTEDGDNIAIGYSGGSVELVTLETTGFIDQEEDTLVIQHSNNNVVPTSEGINTAVVIYNNGATEFAGNDTADATMKIIVTYKILSL